MRLGLNIDHIATLREARKINDPDPLEAVFIAKNCGVHQITIHLREDRRHIDDFDLRRIIESSFLPINVECACNEEIVELICSQKPYKITLVPEKRQEVTTEGGLDMQNTRLKEVIKEFQKNDIFVTTFIDPTLQSLELSKQYHADSIEIHTGHYANLNLMLFSNLQKTKNTITNLHLDRKILLEEIEKSLATISNVAKQANIMGLEVCAGHGLNYFNVHKIAQITQIQELNIGQSIIAKSVFVGLERAIKEMLELLHV